MSCYPPELGRWCKTRCVTHPVRSSQRTRCRRSTTHLGVGRRSTTHLGVGRRSTTHLGVGRCRSRQGTDLVQREKPCVRLCRRCGGRGGRRWSLGIFVRAGAVGAGAVTFGRLSVAALGVVLVDGLAARLPSSEAELVTVEVRVAIGKAILV
jgi:hypothetical protein